MTTPTRTERRIEDARRRIVECTWQLLGETPWSELTVAQICAAADVAPRTFHRYFPDKVELLFSDAAHHEENLKIALARHPFDPAHPARHLIAVLDDVTDEVEPYTADGVRRRQAQIEADDELVSRDLLKRRRLTQIAAEALVERGASPMTAEVWAGAAMAAFSAAMTAWGERGGDLRTHVHAAVGALTHDLRS